MFEKLTYITVQVVLNNLKANSSHCKKSLINTLSYWKCSIILNMHGNYAFYEANWLAVAPKNYKMCMETYLKNLKVQWNMFNEAGHGGLTESHTAYYSLADQYLPHVS